MLVNLLFIALLVVFIVDLSGVVDSIKRALWRLARGKAPYQPYRLKPVDCSLCLTWWCTLLAAWLWNSLSWAVAAYCAALAFSTPLLGSALRLVRDAVGVLLNKLQDFIDKV